MLLEKNKYIFFFFLLITLILRFYSFFPAVFDHDESTYLIIGRDLIQGKHLYVDVTDTKPVGIFMIYGFFYYVFGYSIFLPRLFVAIMIAFTSYLVFFASLKLVQNRTSAIAAGIIYIIYTSIWSNFGKSPNTELFFNLTTIAGFLFFLKNKPWSFSLAGLFFGIGFIIKYVVLFDFVFLAAFFLFMELSLNKWRIGKVNVLKYFFVGIGFSLPFILVNLYFYLGDHFDAFRYITYELPGKYVKGPHSKIFIILILDFITRFIPFSFLFYYVLLKRKGVLLSWQKAMFVAWITGILIAIYLPGKNFEHYTIQLMIPFSLVAGLFFHPDLKKGRYVNYIFNKKIGIPLMIATFLIVQAIGILNNVNDPDKPREIAEYLEHKLEKDDTIYTSDYKHILYYLLRKDSPTKYIHPTLLTNPDHAMAMGIDGGKEIERIIDTQPNFIVVYDNNQFVKNLIRTNYSLDTIFWDGLVEVYRKNN
jgi:4-amino-4-deoxy-L-arabinose transferase-like glycosyltransferase